MRWKLRDVTEMAETAKASAYSRTPVNTLDLFIDGKSHEEVLNVHLET